MVYTMKMVIRNKNTGEVIELSDSVYEVEDAFIQPLQCFYKKDYELVFGYGKIEQKEEE